MTTPPVLCWLRRDFRLSDNPALSAAAAGGAPVIAVAILDEVIATHGAAPAWRWGLAVAAFAEALAARGSRLVLRRGRALDVLRALAAEIGAREVHWTRLYDAASRARDAGVKAGLKADGLVAVSHPGHVLFEPWTVATGQGGFYRVYSPYWRAVKDRDVGAPLPVPVLRAPARWPDSDAPGDWGLAAPMGRGAAVVRPHLAVGEAAAQARLDGFLAEKIETYGARRDDLGRDGTSGLSENLSLGEISARTCYRAGLAAMAAGARGAEKFVKELAWREFAWHLVYHTPEIETRNWRPDWDAFPWSQDADSDAVRAWRRGRTGMPVIDAAMREMYVTGRMHNRARMLAGSYLTKHLMTHWRIGQAWFETCLVDWDAASNAMGWQWVAGTGPDAAPYFRVFNPETQAEKFDAEGRYRRRWVAELSARPPQTALSYFDAIPRRWAMAPGDRYPAAPIVGAAEGRARALEAYGARGF